MSPTLTTFLFELINFLLLAALVGWLLFKPVRASLEARQAAAQAQAADLAARIAEAERIRGDLQRRQVAFEAEMAGARAGRLEAIEREAGNLLSRARAAAAREQEQASRMLDHVEQAQLERLADAVAMAARESVAKLLRLLDAPALHAGLVGAACRQVRAMAGDALGTVLVESAQSLDDADRAVIAEALGQRARSMELRVVPELGAGVRITTTRGLIDASVKGLAAEAGGVVKDALRV